MDYLKFEVEDFLSDSSFQQYCAGTNDEAVSFWTAWQQDHPEKAELVHNARRIYYVLNGNITDENFREDYEAFQTAVNRHGSKTAHPPAPPQLLPGKRRAITWPVLSGMAASLLIAVCLVLYLKSSSNPASGGQVYVSPAGKRTIIQLAEGTKVILNSSSTLTLDRAFNGSTREVSLEGEAYFEVVHNSEKPFTVHTRQADIHDVGTKFNVKSYPDDKNVETSLIEGAIRITVNGAAKGKMVALKPGEKLVLANAVPEGNETPATTKRYVVSNITTNAMSNSVVETDWTQNKLTFYNQSFEEIALQMERWYDVKFTINNPAVKNYRFTATFDNENIVEVLEALKLTASFKYRKEGNVLIID